MFSFVEPGAIWGGIKQTGIGRSHGYFGLLDLVNIKFISTDYLNKKNQLWWFPYEKSLPRIIEKSLTLFHHKKGQEKIKALLSLIPYMGQIKAGVPLRNFIKIFPRLFRR